MVGLISCLYNGMCIKITLLGVSFTNVPLFKESLCENIFERYFEMSIYIVTVVECGMAVFCIILTLVSFVETRKMNSEHLR